MPVWTLVPTPAEWRWLEDRREDRPWYPTGRLFREPTHGTWEPVIARVVATLRGAATTA